MIEVVKTIEDMQIAVASGVCYISGPITGVDDYGERFMNAENRLTAAGIRSINPAGAFPEGLPYDWYMEIDLHLVSMCDALCFIEGYANSNGAGREAQRANQNKKGYWAFTLGQLKCYEEFYYWGDMVGQPDFSPEEIAQKEDDCKKKLAHEGAELEVWIQNVHPPKTEKQKQNDKVKKILRSYLYCQHQIDMLCDEILKLDSRRKRITVQYREVHGGGGCDYTEAVIDNIKTLEDTIMARTKQLQSERTKVQFWIDSLEDYRERNVLNMCYINGMQFENIAKKLNYSIDHVKRMHGRGINKLRELLQDIKSKK